MLAWCRNFEIDKGSKWVKNEWSSWAFKDSHKVIFCPASGAGASPLMSPFTMLCCLVLMYSSEAWKHWKPRSLNPIGPKMSKEPTWKEDKRRSLLHSMEHVCFKTARAVPKQSNEVTCSWSTCVGTLEGVAQWNCHKSGVRLGVLHIQYCSRSVAKATAMDFSFRYVVWHAFLHHESSYVA